LIEQKLCCNDFPCADSAVESEEGRSCAFRHSGTILLTVEIKTEIHSVILRLLKEEDAEELSLRVDQNREHLRRWMPWLDGAKGPADQLKFIQRCSECAATGTGFHYGVLLGGEIVGMVSFNSIEKHNRCATMVKFQQRYQMRHGIRRNPFHRLGFRSSEHPQNSAPFSSQFWELNSHAVP
jgi:Acetyltransferase (GNAT) domain